MNPYKFTQMEGYPLKYKFTTIIGAAALGALFVSPAAQAQDKYVFGSIGLGMLSDSDNRGAFSSDFLTGEGTTIPLDTFLPEGTPVGWKTDFDNGAVFSAGLGHRYGDQLRIELELSYQSHDVDTHRGVKAAGIELADEDAAVLISGASNIGASVAEVVASGRGDISATSFFVNGLYDFPMEGALTPYLGLGIGWSKVDVSFKPSGVGIVSDDDTVFAYQLIGGLSYGVSESSAIYGAYKYRRANDVEVQTSLFPATLDIETAGSILEIGYRIHF
ncbi:MAG: porin family protein [Alphaproteobacteria bacterium]|nr:MAG: porin family protein [Alphaproteobacteria bacterium]